MDLEQIVGKENVRPGAAEDAVSGVVPAWVAAPRTREEAAQVIVAAREAGWGLVPRGGGTLIDLGFPPERLDLVLSTRNLNRVVDYQPDDMTITVDAGVTLEAIRVLLSQRGQFLPLDPPSSKTATAGGTVATAAVGLWGAGFGGPRDWVIGCRVLGADGLEVRGGGQVVKNVAGYDLPKLYTRSHGTLGLITEVTFKVMPRPPVAATCWIAVPNATVAEALIGSIRGSDLQPTILEFLSPVGDEVTNLRNLAGPWALLLQFHHVPEAVEWQIRRVTELAREAGCPTQRLENPVVEEAILLELRDLSRTAPFSARLNVVSSKAAEVCARAAELLDKQGQLRRVAAHAATGHVRVLADDTAGADLAEALRGIAREAGGNCLFPQLPAALVGKVDPWGDVGPELGLMRGIKATLDPNRLFSPGRFVGRL